MDVHRSLTPTIGNLCPPSTTCRECGNDAVFFGNAVAQNRGNAVARATGGKSGCDGQCRFLTIGGLHRTSGEAPLVETQHYHTNPSWCHVNKAKSSSSMRTQVASVAYLHNQDKYAKRSTWCYKYMNANRKKSKQLEFLKQLPRIRRVASEKSLSLDFLKKNIVVCDGGNNNCDGIKLTLTSNSVHCLRIRNGDLWVEDTSNQLLGLRYEKPGSSDPVFIRLPRQKSLAIMSNGQGICQAMRVCALSQRGSLFRGSRNFVFTDGDNKYCCVGAQQGRAEKGIKSGLYRMKNGFPCKEWDVIHNVLKRGEHAFDMYMDTQVIQHISYARKRVHFATMTSSLCAQHNKEARYYNGLGFGVNVYLRSHIDQDFTMSVVQAHIDDHDYKVNDRIICYFAFPRIGRAVALRPGDFLLFNPQEPHSISSRCCAGDEIFCISSYLKTGVVGGNDNSDTVV